MWACFSRSPAVAEDEGGRVVRREKRAGRRSRRQPAGQEAQQDALRPTSSQQRECTDDRPAAASVSATSSWQGSSVLSEYGGEPRDACSLDESAWPTASACADAGWLCDRGQAAGYPTHFCGDASGRKPLLNHPYYKVEKRDLARGSCASVALTVNTRTGRRVAIKFIPRASCSSPSGLVLRELQNHKACHGHPHIVELVEVFPTRTDLAVVMEYASGGDMSQLIEDTLRSTGRAVPESECRRLFQQLTVAVDYCHRLGIANRDIKLDNLLLQPSRDGGPPNLKMCDFGLSKDEERQSISQSSCGTPEYVAPEILRCGLGECYSGKSADVWACGVSLYILIAGAFPFLRLEEERRNDIERMQLMFPRILAGDFQPLPAHVSPDCADLIGRMLTPDPAQRITVRQILRHPWVAAGMPLHLTRLNETLIRGVGAVPCERDDGFCDGSDKAGDEDGFGFSALSASTVGGQSRTSSGGAVQLSLGGGLRVGSSGDGGASRGTAVMLRLLGGRPGHQQQQQIQGQHHDGAAAAAALTHRSSVSRASGGSNLSRLSGGSVAAAYQQHLQQFPQQHGPARHIGGGGRQHGDASLGNLGMQQIVALLEQMAADDRAAAERPWRSMDLPAAARPPVPLARQLRGCAGNPSLDLGRTPVRSAAQPHTPNTLPLSSVLPGRLLPPVRSSFAMAPARHS